MKKSLCIFILAAAAGLCAILFAFRAVDSGKGNITVTETVLAGDAAAAEGISVEIGTHWEGHLLWSTKYQPGRVQEAVSEFDFSSQTVRWNDTDPWAWSSSFTESGEVGVWRDYSTSNVDLDVISTTFGTAMAGDAVTGKTYYDVEIEHMPWSRLLQAAADQTAAGETSTVTLRIRDYYDYYPLELSVISEYMNYSWDSWGEFATEYFKLPIPEDEKIQVTIRKDWDGKVIMLNCRGLGEGYFPVTTSARGDTGCYFAFYLQGKGVEEIQRDLGGRYAVYWLPFAEESGSRKSIADVEQMKDAAQLPEDAIPVTMRLDREGQVLYLLARQKNQYILLTYSVNEGELSLRQQLVIHDTVFAADAGSAAADGTEHTAFRKMTVQEEGVLLTWQDNRFAYIAREGEEYRLWCAGIFPAEARKEEEWEKKTPYGYTDCESAFPYEHAFAFDGTRLVLAAFENWGSMDTRLLVYKEGELVYSGYYQYSGELDTALGMDKKIIPWGDRFSMYRRQGTSVNPLHVSME